MSAISLHTAIPAEIEAAMEVDALARAHAISWAPNTRRSYVAGWKDFTRNAFVAILSLIRDFGN